MCWNTPYMAYKSCQTANREEAKVQVLLQYIHTTPLNAHHYRNTGLTPGTRGVLLFITCQTVQQRLLEQLWYLTHREGYTRAIRDQWSKWSRTSAPYLPHPSRQTVTLEYLTWGLGDYCQSGILECSCVIGVEIIFKLARAVCTVTNQIKLFLTFE